MRWIALGLGIALAAVRRGPTRGLWWDGNARSTFAHLPLYLDRAQEFGFNEFCIGLHGQRDAQFTFHDFDPDELARFCEALRARRITPSVMIWPWPTVDYLRSMENGALVRTMRDLSIKTVELDVEGYNWNRRDPAGFATRDEAAQEIFATLRSGGLRVGATTYPEGVSGSREVCNRADYVAVQAYSQHKADSDNYGFGQVYGPGNMQRLAARRVAEYAPNAKLIQGLAAYNQEFPGVEPDLAMRTAYDAAIETAPIGVRWWSAGWAIAWRRQAYCTRFFGSLGR